MPTHSANTKSRPKVSSPGATMNKTAADKAQKNTEPTMRRPGPTHVFGRTTDLRIEGIECIGVEVARWPLDLARALRWTLCRSSVKRHTSERDRSVLSLSRRFRRPNGYRRPFGHPRAWMIAIEESRLSSACVQV